MDLVPLGAKSLDKVLPEPLELLSDILLASGCGGPRREAGANWLLNPDNVGQLMPAPGVLDGIMCPVLPQERPILLEETREGRASRLVAVWSISQRSGGLTVSIAWTRRTHTAIEPNEDLLIGFIVGRREEPEEEPILIVRVGCDGKRTGIRLPNVESYFGNAGTIDREAYIQGEQGERRTERV